MSALAILGSDLRTQEVEGQPWFHAGDACRLLGLNRGTEEVMLLGEDERKVIDGQLGIVAAKAGLPMFDSAPLFKLILSA